MGWRKSKYDDNACIEGLEFETVFLPGWEEGLFPHQKSIEEKGQSGLEEERRLACWNN